MIDGTSAKQLNLSEITEVVSSSVTSMGWKWYRSRWCTLSLKVMVVTLAIITVFGEPIRRKIESSKSISPEWIIFQIQRSTSHPSKWRMAG